MDGTWAALLLTAALAAAGVMKRGSAAVSDQDRIELGIHETIENFEDRTGRGAPEGVILSGVNRVLRHRGIRVSRRELEIVLLDNERRGMFYQDATGWRLN